MADYKQALDSHLKGSSFMRHLFNKLGKVVTVEFDNGMELRGYLTSIDILWKGIEIQDPINKVTYFINFKHVRKIIYEE